MNIYELQPIITKPELQKLVAEKNTRMPQTLAHVLTPLELGKIWVVHPTTNDPVLVSEKFGTVAIWFDF
jgi:hypothetical protein